MTCPNPSLITIFLNRWFQSAALLSVKLPSKAFLPVFGSIGNPEFLILPVVNRDTAVLPETDARHVERGWHLARGEARVSLSSARPDRRRRRHDDRGPRRHGMRPNRTFHLHRTSWRRVRPNATSCQMKAKRLIFPGRRPGSEGQQIEIQMEGMRESPAVAPTRRGFGTSLLKVTFADV